MADIIYKDFQAQSLNAGSSLGVISARASTFNSVDNQGDIILSGAFSKTLSEKSPDKIKFLYQHDPFYPLGVITGLVQTKTGLEMKAKFALKSEFAKDKYELAKLGAFGGVSIGFTIPKGKSHIRPDGIREISEVKLMEISLVTFPANTEAVIESIKERSPLVSALKKAFNAPMEDAMELASEFTSLAEEAKDISSQADKSSLSREAQTVSHSLKELLKEACKV